MVISKELVDQTVELTRQKVLIDKLTEVVVKKAERIKELKKIICQHKCLLEKKEENSKGADESKTGGANECSVSIKINRLYTCVQICLIP